MRFRLFVLFVVVFLLAGCSGVPTIGQGETRDAGPTITFNMAPVANYGSDSTTTGDSSSWADTNEGARTGSATPTTTNTPTTTVDATIPLPGSAPISAAGAAREKPGAKPGELEAGAILPAVLLGDCAKPGAP